MLNKLLRDSPESLPETTGSLSGSKPINSGCVENRFNLKISLCKYKISKMAAGAGVKFLFMENLIPQDHLDYIILDSHSAMLLSMAMTPCSQSTLKNFIKN